MPDARLSPLAAAEYSLATVWEVYSKHQEYLGNVRRSVRNGATVYEPERRDGKPVRPPRGLGRTTPGWPTKDSAAAALVLSYS